MQQATVLEPTTTLIEDLPECLCGGCGLKIPVDAGFCPDCGLSLDIASSAPSLPPSEDKSERRKLTVDTSQETQLRISSKVLYVMGIALILIAGYSGFQVWSTKQRATAQARLMLEQHAIELNKLKKETDEARRVAEQEKLVAEQNAKRELELLQTEAQQVKDEKEKAEKARLEAERVASDQNAKLDDLELNNTLKSLDQTAQLDSYSKQISSLPKVKSYPRLARMRGWQGVVTIRLDFDVQGRAVAASIEQTSGYSLLDSDALEKVKSVASYPIPPTSLIGKTFSISIPIKYSLD
jgi:TonB family protein